MQDYRSLTLLLLLALCVGCREAPVPMALGTLERDQLLVRASVAEQIVEQPVQEGMTVAAGDLLLQLDGRRQHWHGLQAEAQVAQAQAWLTRLQHGERIQDIAAAQAFWQQQQTLAQEAERQWQRLQSLYRQQMIGQAELDRGEAQWRALQAQVQAAKQAWEKAQQGARPEEIEQAQAMVSAAEAEQGLQGLLQEELTLRAPAAGWIESLPLKVGERTQVGQVVAVLTLDQAPYARVYLPQPWRLRVVVGQSLPVWLDGRVEPLSGTVRFISEEPAYTPYYALNEHDRARLVYRMDVLLPEAQALPAGVPVQVELPRE